MPLTEKQYELDGVIFGLGTSIEVVSDGWTPTSGDLATSDVQRTSGDGVRFGRDRRGSATWGFSLFTNMEDEVAAWDALSPLAHAWDNEDVRATPDSLNVLRYRVAGQDRRVYGRARRWTTSPNNLSLAGRIDVTADFATVDGLIYDDAEQSTIIPLTARQSGGGVVLPTVLPTTLAARTGARTGSITVGGKVPTPIVLAIKGAVSNARVTATTRVGAQLVRRWSAALVDRVDSGDVVTFDPRPWARSATNKQGAGVRVRARDTQIAKLLLPPGTHDIVFTGSDPQSDPSVTVRWRNAQRAPR